MYNYVTNFGWMENKNIRLLLRFLRGKFVHPSEFGLAVLAHYISDHVTACEHDPVLHRRVGQIDDPFEEVGPSSGPRESSADQFPFVGQIGFACGARVQLLAPDMIEEDLAHFVELLLRLG